MRALEIDEIQIGEQLIAEGIERIRKMDNKQHVALCLLGNALMVGGGGPGKLAYFACIGIHHCRERAEAQDRQAVE